MSMKILRALGLVGLSCVLWLPASLHAQVPLLINYQGRLLNGTNLVNGSAAISLRLFDAPALGTLLYEDSNSVAVVDGLYSTFIGDDTMAGSLTNALIAPNLFLEIAMDGVALAPRERVASVANALQAYRVRDGGVTTDALAEGAVTSVKIQPNSLDFDRFKQVMSVDGFNIVKITNSSLLAFDLANTGSLGIQTTNGTFAYFDASGDIGLDFNTLFVDRSVHRVGLGLSTPSERLTVNGNIAPSLNGSFNLGNTTQQWRTIYLTSQVNFTSNLNFVVGSATGLVVSPAGITAASFVGNGAGLANVNAASLDGLDALSFLRSDAPAVYNEAGNDMDIRFEGDHEQNLLFLDASTDRVGIGTATPGYDLHVVGSPAVSTLLVSPDVMPSGGISELRLAEDRVGTYAWIIQNDGGANLLRFLSTPGVGLTNAPTMVLSSSGLGVGTTTSSDGKLEVRQTGLSDILNLYDDSQNVMTVKDGGKVGIGISDPVTKLDVNGTFRVGSTTLYVDPSLYYVGIGATNPTTTKRLEVYGSPLNLSVKAAIVNAGSGPSNHAGLEFSTDSGSFHVGVSALADSFMIHTNAVFYGTPFLVVENGGNVGIGVVSPTNKLQVAGTVQATAYITGSDRNMKENIKPISADEILAKVSELPLATWNFRDDTSGTHLGPMAQDFKAAFDLGNTDSGIFTVDADGVALAAIQALAAADRDQQLEVRSQQEKIDALEQTILELRARLDALERR